MDKLLFTLGIIWLSLSCGYAVQRYMAQRTYTRGGRPPLDLVRRKLQLFALFACIPVSAMLSLWGLPEPDPRLLALPLLGICAWSAGGLLGLVGARWLRLDRPQQGSMFCCGAFTNIGAIGALICVVFWGEQTIAWVTLYRLCEECFFFGIAFPVSQWFGSPTSQKTHPDFSAVFKDPGIRIVLVALVTGILLNRLAVPRPEICGTIASGCAILATALFLFAIGMGLHLSSFKNYIRQCLTIACIKFLGVPFLIVSLGWLLGLGSIDNGLPLKVVMIISAMPVAMNALVPPALFHLDVDLANACWLFTTGALVVVVPILLVLTV